MAQAPSKLPTDPLPAVGGHARPAQRCAGGDGLGALAASKGYKTGNSYFHVPCGWRDPSSSRHERIRCLHGIGTGTCPFSCGDGPKTRWPYEQGLASAPPFLRIAPLSAHCFACNVTQRDLALDPALALSDELLPH